jgi:hypothetical protein
MVMQFYGINKSLGDVANEVMFPSPGDTGEWLGESAAAIRDYLGDYGLQAVYLRGQDWQSITKYIKKGIPLIVGVRAHPEDVQANHAWVIRGIADEGGNDIIFNNPWKNPGDEDPVAFDPDADNIPGQTMPFKEFKQDYWTSPIAGENCSIIVVSYKGMAGSALESIFDWRGAAFRIAGDFYYHLTRFGKKLIRLELIEAALELVLVAIGLAGLVVGAIQLIGQLLEAGGKWLIRKGRKLWDEGGLGNRILGGLMMAFGAIIAGVGYVIDFFAGVAGAIIDAVGSFFDALGSIFTGGNSDSNDTQLDESKLIMGINLSVSPWRSRWGDNWERISGSWVVATQDGTALDDLEVSWRIQIWGWGVDSWTLSRRVLEHNGSLNVDEISADTTRYNKRFRACLSNSQGVRMAFGTDKCRYGGDGGLTRVKLRVKVVAKRGGSRVEMSESTSVWGLST